MNIISWLIWINIASIQAQLHHTRCQTKCHWEDKHKAEKSASKTWSWRHYYWNINFPSRSHLEYKSESVDQVSMDLDGGKHVWRKILFLFPLWTCAQRVIAKLTGVVESDTQAIKRLLDTYRRQTFVLVDAACLIDKNLLSALQLFTTPKKTFLLALNFTAESTQQKIIFTFFFVSEFLFS